MRRALLLIGGVLGACSTQPPAPPEPTHIPTNEPAAPAPAGAAPAPAQAPARTGPAVQSRLLGRTVRPQAPRPLNLKTECRFENETGYSGTASVEVVNSQVKRLAAMFNVPGHGQCLIDMARLRQTHSTPTVELRDGGTGCTARMWEQGDKATISFSGCASYCSNPVAFQYVWPILVARPAGTCQ